MELEAISSAATIAVASTIIFLVVAKAWNAVARTTSSTPNFSDQILREAAQRFRDELERLNRSQATWLSGALVFILLFTAAYLFNVSELFTGYPHWQLYLYIAVLVTAIGYEAFRFTRRSIAQRNVKFVRDANIAIGHQLLQLPAGFARVFHDVPTAAGVIDHVLVGQKGVYAVNVIAERSRKRAHTRLRDNTLQFSNNAANVSLIDVCARTHQLQKEFRELTGSALRVRSVIAVPGWSVDEQSGDAHLLVNERTVHMLRGWKDNTDYLMNEDVTALQNELVSRCVAS